MKVLDSVCLSVSFDSFFHSRKSSAVTPSVMLPHIPTQLCALPFALAERSGVSSLFSWKVCGDLWQLNDDVGGKVTLAAKLLSSRAVVVLGDPQDPRGCRAGRDQL